MIGDREGGPWPALSDAIRVGDEIVLAVHQSREHAAHRARCGVGSERRRHVVLVQRQRNLCERHRDRHAHFDQRVAPADQIGAVRQRDDFEIEGRERGLGIRRNARQETTGHQ